MAIASLILGILSIILAFLGMVRGLLGPILGIVGIVLAVIAINKAKAEGRTEGINTAALVVSIVGAAIGGIAYFAVWRHVYAVVDAFSNELKNLNF